MKEILPQDDLILLKRLQAGDEAAFADLYTMYSPSLISFAAARLSSLEEASDIIHDIFVKLWEDRKDLNIKLSPAAYLFAATRYRIIDHIRKQATKQKAYSEKISRLPDYLMTSEDEVYNKELNKALHDAVEQLSPRVKEVFRMSRFEQLSTKEIAEKLDVSESTVKNQLTTALGQLRAILDKYFFLLWWM